MKRLFLVNAAGEVVTILRGDADPLSAPPGHRLVPEEAMPPTWTMAPPQAAEEGPSLEKLASRMERIEKRLGLIP